MPIVSLGDIKKDFAAATAKVAKNKGYAFDAYTRMVATATSYEPKQTEHFLKGEWEKLGEDGDLIARDHLQYLQCSPRPDGTLEEAADRFIDNKKVRKASTSGLVVDRAEFASRLRAHISAEGITHDGQDMLARNVFNDLHQSRRGPLIDAMLDPTITNLALPPQYFEIVAEDCGFKVPMTRAKPVRTRDKPPVEADGVAGGGRR